METEPLITRKRKAHVMATYRIASQSENCIAPLRLWLMNSVRVFFFLGWSRGRLPPLLTPVAWRAVVMGSKVVRFADKRETKAARGYKNGIEYFIAIVKFFSRV